MFLGLNNLGVKSATDYRRWALRCFLHRKAVFSVLIRCALSARLKGHFYLEVYAVAKMANEKSKIWAANQLRDKATELGRIPKKDDFDEVTRSRIKAFLGPWPRALEAAELKAPKEKPAKKRRKPQK